MSRDSSANAIAAIGTEADSCSPLAPAGSLRLLQTATADNYDEAGYLGANPDVARAVADGIFASGRIHFDCFGIGESRRQRRSIPPQWRRTKLDRLSALLKTDAVQTIGPDHIDCLSDAARERFAVVATDNVSAHEYDDRALSLIGRNTDGLVLDCGAGLRNTYYRNVVNCEIVAYDSTDVLAAAEDLPFLDASFDAVICVNVLEHVKDPFRAASELMRVLKPGGELMCVAPFLQPLHGYPQHYYNMTQEGLLNLFEPLSDCRIEIYGAMRPIWALHWFVSSYRAGLPEALRERFETMTIAELLASPQSLESLPIATALSSHACTELASAHALFGRKPVAMAKDLRSSGPRTELG